MYVKDEISNSITIEKSVFITYLKHIKTEAEYKEYLTSIKKKHYDASHVCSAFIIKDIKRSSDDKEPSGTAGRPILNVLEKNNLDETCALVVRYFGGIKLGTGGLTRAYSNSITEALKKAKLVKEVIYPVYQITLSYELANKIDYYINNSTILINKKYEENVTIEFALDSLEKIGKIKELTKGIEPIYIKDEIREEGIIINDGKYL